jgi:GNAT superfamily N-acetyltransferase
MDTLTYTVQRVPVERIFALRKAVLRPHLSDSEPFVLDDDLLPTTVAFGAITPDDRVVGAARLSPEPPPFADHAGAGWRLRGMSTSPDLRNRGIGSAVLRGVIDYVAAAGGGVLWANARLAALSLYERGGMHPWGERWEEPDIGPHLVMWREVPDAAEFGSRQGRQ